MFNKEIVLSDAFLDMPMSARCLYFTLGMLADDDGFIGNAKSIMRQCGASIDDMNILKAKSFIIDFENGVIVIKHWRMNNLLRNDRYKPTPYLEEKSMLCEKKNGAYTLDKLSGIPMVNQMDTNGKPSIGKDSIVKYSIEEKEIYKEKEAEKPSECLVEKVSDSESSVVDNPRDKIPYKKIIDYLNTKTGKSFQNVHTNRRYIKARFNEGYTEEDFYKVIDNMYARWINTEYEEYLQPSTLFGNKFDKYLNKPNKPYNTKKDIQVEYSDKDNVKVTREEVLNLLKFQKKSTEEINNRLKKLGFEELTQEELKEIEICS